MSHIFSLHKMKIAVGTFLVVLSAFFFSLYAQASVNNLAFQPGWNVFSTPKTLLSITFDNGGTGLAFYKLEDGQWSSTTIAPTVENIKPLEGFMVYNSNSSAVNVELIFKITGPSDLLHQKTLNSGWNLVGVANSDFANGDTVTGTQAFDSLNTEDYGSVVDFTAADFADTLSTDIAASTVSTITSSEVGSAYFAKNKAYPIFIKKDNVTYGGTQEDVIQTNVSVLSQSASEDALIGSSGVEVLKFQITAGGGSNLTFNEFATIGEVVDSLNPHDGTDVLDNTRVLSMHFYQVNSGITTELDAKSGSQIFSQVMTFDGFFVNIPAGQTKEFLVTMDVTDDINQENDTLRFGLDSIGLEDTNSDQIATLTVNGQANISASNITTATSYKSARTVTIIFDAGSALNLTVDNTDSETDKAKYVLGNTTSDFVASYELTAVDGNIRINDLRVSASNVGFSDFTAAVNEVILYAGDKTTEIARQSVVGTDINFTDIDYTLAEGSENLYVKVVANKMGQDEAGKIVNDIFLALEVTDAEGISSDENYLRQINGGDGTNSISTSNPIVSGNALAFSTIPTRISSVEFVSSYGGQSVSTSLTNGENNVAILKLTTDASSNVSGGTGSTLKTKLNALRFTVDTDTSLTATGITVERINGPGTDDVASVASFTGTVATMDTTSLSSTNLEIDNSSSAYFLVKTNVSGLSSVNQGYVQIKLNDLDSGTGSIANIVYTSDDDVGIGNLEEGVYPRVDLRLDNDSLSAAMVFSNY